MNAFYRYYLREIEAEQDLLKANLGDIQKYRRFSDQSRASSDLPRQWNDEKNDAGLLNFLWADSFPVFV